MRALGLASNAGDRQDDARLWRFPNNKALLDNAPRSRTGGASGVLSTPRLLSQTAGVALVAPVFGAAGAGGTGQGRRDRDGFARIAPTSMKRS